MLIFLLSMFAMFVSVKSSDADTVVYSVFVFVSTVTVVSDAASVAVSCFNSSSDIMRPVKDNIFVKNSIENK